MDHEVVGMDCGRGWRAGQRRAKGKNWDDGNNTNNKTLKRAIFIVC